MRVELVWLRRAAAVDGGGDGVEADEHDALHGGACVREGAGLLLQCECAVCSLVCRCDSRIITAHGGAAHRCGPVVCWLLLWVFWRGHR